MRKTYLVGLVGLVLLLLVPAASASPIKRVELSEEQKDLVEATLGADANIGALLAVHPELTQLTIPDYGYVRAGRVYCLTSNSTNCTADNPIFVSVDYREANSTNTTNATDSGWVLRALVRINGSNSSQAEVIIAALHREGALAVLNQYLPPGQGGQGQDDGQNNGNPQGPNNTIVRRITNEDKENALEIMEADANLSAHFEALDDAGIPYTFRYVPVVKEETVKVVILAGQKKQTPVAMATIDLEQGVVTELRFLNNKLMRNLWQQMPVIQGQNQFFPQFESDDDSSSGPNGKGKGNAYGRGKD